MGQILWPRVVIWGFDVSENSLIYSSTFIGRANLYTHSSGMEGSVAFIKSLKGNAWRLLFSSLSYVAKMLLN